MSEENHESGVIGKESSGEQPVPDAKESKSSTIASSDRDPVAWAAWAVFMCVGGLLVFSFAWSLLPAMEAQAKAACRPLSPVIHETPQLAPDLELQDLQGNKRKLSDFRGRMVVLNFWATWCEPCITEWPDLDKLGQRLAGREDVVVLAVSVDESTELVAQFLKQMSLEATEVQVLWDPTKNSYKTFGSTKLPDTYFVDVEGNVTSAFVNARRWGRPEAFRCVDASAR